jgi:hypothetical protein
LTLATRVIESLAEGPPLNGHERRMLETTPAIIDDRRRVSATCDIVHGCGRSFAIAPRTKHEREALGRPLLCDSCKRPARIRVTVSMKRYWQSLYTEAEIVELAEAIWGPRDEWT